MCTTVIVGKAVSKTGRVIVGHNEDAGGRVFHQQFYVPGGKHADSDLLVAEPGRAKVPQAAETLSTYWSNMLQIDGSSFDQGYANEAGLVICSNGGGSSFDGDDPDEAALGLKDGGVGFLLRRIMAERAKTAREAMEIAAKLLDEYGYFGSARNYTVADKNEAWCLNVVKGHHYVAKRIPDDKVMLISNMLAIRHVDINVHEIVIAPADLIEYAIKKGRYTPKVPGDYSDFDFAMAYQSDENRHAPTKSVRMRLGWWAITGNYYGDELHYPELLSPAHAMGVEDVRDVLGLTCYESYAMRGDGKEDAFQMFNTQLLPLHFQEELERQCWLQGSRRQTAPAQRMLDFTRKKLSYDLPESSYSPGLISSPLHFWMPEFISKRLSLGFQQFGRSSHGFLTNEAVMIGVETRTSSPVRIIRDKETLQHVTVRGLFPCGEGAGYAGGIVSAGVDGERCAEAVANYLNQSSEQ